LGGHGIAFAGAAANGEDGLELVDGSRARAQKQLAPKPRSHQTCNRITVQTGGHTEEES
jgi:hypothetical protein